MLCVDVCVPSTELTSKAGSFTNFIHIIIIPIILSSSSDYYCYFGGLVRKFDAVF